MGSRRRTHDFYLGTVDRGALTLFTGMGEFRSHDAAVRYYDKQPRSGSRRTIVTVEYVPVVKRGVEYGLRHIVRNLDGDVMTGSW